MNDRIIRISFKADIRMVALKPAIERVVQEQVGEERARNTPLRGTTRPLLPGAVRPLDGSAEPPC